MASPHETDQTLSTPESSAPGAEPVHRVVGMEDFDPDDQDPRPLTIPPLRRILLVLGILAALAALVFVPPLVSMNRYRRQIASSISASLGRPVRIDSVALNVFPMPGLTLKNFVVSEEPAFGSEPTIRANSVTVMLRVSSLWGRRVEFSRIALDAPSVNLVRLPDGRWNLESILLQASHVQAAPTAQRKAGSAPRFPYIEATGARLNFKSGIEKLPISLTDASFALWLPQPDRWQLRLEAHPARTDTAATDTGVFRVEGTLGRAASLAAVPVNLSGSWSDAPLGAVSWILLGRDLGIRGSLLMHVTVNGSAGDSAITIELSLGGLRRAEFVPERTLAVDLRCDAQALALFHRFGQIHCVWPQADAPGGLVISASVPDVLHPAQAEAAASLKAVPAAALLDALKAASARPVRDLTAQGSLNGELRYGVSSSGQASPGTPRKHSGRRVQAASVSQTPALSGTITVASAKLALADHHPFVATDISASLAADDLTVPPFPLLLGGTTPAFLSAHADRAGYTLHLTGPVLRSRLRELAHSLPQFGDGLPAALVGPTSPPASTARAQESALRIDLTSTRLWRGGQTWTSAAAGPKAAPGRADRRRPLHTTTR